MVFLVRLVDREKHREAVTTRPDANPSHSTANRVQSQLAEASAFLQSLLTTADQLTRVERILIRIKLIHRPPHGTKDYQTTQELSSLGVGFTADLEEGL
jgi:hypothetical protein